jgi:Carboxypeptidase regulatory-like domain/Dockerin type I domain
MDKHLQLSMICVVLISAVTWSVWSQSPGDVNGDGVINSEDTGLINDHLLGLLPLAGDALTRANGNLDGVIDAADVVWTVSHYAGSIGTVSGFVYYAGSTIPVSGVTVQIGSSTATSGGNGEYILINVPAGQHTLTATKAGFDPYSRTLDVPPEGFAWNVEVTSSQYTFTLSGTLYDGMPTPGQLSGVTVTVLNPNGSSSNLIDTTDFTGHYQITNVPQGSRTVRFEKEYYDTREPVIFMSNADKVYNEQLTMALIVPPTDLQASVNWVEASVSWQDLGIPTLSEYVVYRSTSSDSDYIRVSPIALSGTSFDDLLPNNFQPYYYRVASLNLEGQEGEMSSPVQITPQTGGVMNTVTTWQGDIKVETDLTVRDDGELHIEPGTNVFLDENTDISIQTVLNAIGTEADNITFTSSALVPQPGDWGFIRLSQTLIDHLSGIEFCVFEYGLYVKVERSAPQIDNCIFRHMGRDL